MDPRHVREIGTALAYTIGDRRDWPLQCGWCGSENLFLDYVNRALCCNDCGKWTSQHVAHELREQRARKEVMGGVGAWTVTYAEWLRSPEGIAFQRHAAMIRLHRCLTRLLERRQSE